MYFKSILNLNLKREYYLTSLSDELYFAMARIRTCNHRLPIEAGRYGVNRANTFGKIDFVQNVGIVDLEAKGLSCIF